MTACAPIFRDAGFSITPEAAGGPPRPGASGKRFHWQAGQSARALMAKPQATPAP